MGIRGASEGHQRSIRGASEARTLSTHTHASPLGMPSTLRDRSVILGGTPRVLSSCSTASLAKLCGSPRSRRRAPRRKPLLNAAARCSAAVAVSQADSLIFKVDASLIRKEGESILSGECGGEGERHP